MKTYGIFNWDNEDGPWGKPRGTKGRGQRPQSGRPHGNAPDLDDIIQMAQERFQRFSNNRNGGGGSSGGGAPLKMSGGVLGLIAGAAVVVWLLSGFYIVAPDEQGVVLRFGEYVQTTNEGLNYHLPYPVETVIKPKVTRENVVEVGFRTGGQASRFLQRTGLQSRDNTNVLDVTEESLMLTGDENIVDLDFTVRWRIAAPQDYLFNVQDVEGTIKRVAESVMREVIGQHPIDDALTDNKTIIQQEAMAQLQQVMESYQAGVLITGVELQQVNPPTEVIDAFRDVQAARADAEKSINEAIGYSNDILPRARGQAAQILQEAEGYKQAKVAEASGSAERFLAQLKEYRNAPAVTRERLYLETMQDVVRQSDKIILPEGMADGALPYLPLNAIRGGAR